MVTSLQKASFGKRIMSAIFDGILLSILAVGLAAVLSLAFGYNNYMDKVSDTYAKYEAEYNVKFQISAEEYNDLSETEKANYNTAYEELIKDKDLLYNYNMLLNLTLLIITFSILPAVLGLEFVVPLLFGNGQTLGKKIFGIALMNTESVKVTNVQLFARAILGKFAIEIMIPLSIILMMFFNSIGILGGLILIGIVIIEAICIISTNTNSAIHDLLAQTVAVDMASQRIFESRDALIEHKKALHAEEAQKADY
jgi:uncharacterized RDD family membrane protein YckC